MAALCKKFLPGGDGALQGGEVHKALVQLPAGGVLQQGLLDLPLDQGGVDHRHNAHHGGAEGDGDGDAQNVPDDIAGSVGHVPAAAGFPEAGQEEADDHIDQSDHRAHRHAGNGAGGGHLRGLAHFDEGVGQRQADKQLAQGLDDLGDGGGSHVKVPLAVAAQGGQTAHAHHRRGQGPDAGGGLGVVHQAGQGVCLEVHDQEGKRAQNQEHAQSQLEGAAHLIAPALSVGLAYQLGDSHGQAGGGDGEQDGVDVVGVVEVGVALGPDDVVQGDLVEHADQLDHHGAYRQNGSPTEEGVLFLSAAPARGHVISGHRPPPD